MLLFCLPAFYACTPRADITGSWKAAEYSPDSIRKIVIVTLNGSVEARRAIENNLAEALGQHGYQAVKGMDILPAVVDAESEQDRAALLEKIQGSEADAILTVALLNEHTEERYVPGTDPYNPVPRFGYAPRFWGYYSDRYPVLNTPAYYQEDKIYFLETNLYDAKTEALLWSAQSETYSPGSLSPVSRDFVAMVIGRMEADGIIREK